MRQRRPYLLLEVLIAMALVALAAIPLLAPGIWMIKYEKKFNQQIEADREASLLFAAIVESFYKGGGGVVALPEGFTVEIEKIDKGDEEKDYILYSITIEYRNLKFFYELFAERKKGGPE